MKTKQGSPVLRVKDFGDDGRFAGYGSVFGNRDSYGDVVMRGAFKETLEKHAASETMPKLFWQHDPWQPIGKWLEMKEDETGLKVEGQLNMSVQQGREAHALLKAGDIDGLSIGYRIVEAEDKDGVQQLNKLDLVEVSVVSLGANDQALVSAVKNIRAGGLPALPDFECFLRDAGGFSRKEAKVIASHGLAYLLRRDADEGGEPQAPDSEAMAFLQALRSTPVLDLTGEPD